MLRDWRDKAGKWLDRWGRIQDIRELSTLLWDVGQWLLRSIGVIALVLRVLSIVNDYWVIAFGIVAFVITFIPTVLSRDARENLVTPKEEPNSGEQGNKIIPLRFAHDGVDWEDHDTLNLTEASIKGPFCPKCGSLLGMSFLTMPSAWHPLRDEDLIGGLWDQGSTFSCANWDFSITPHATRRTVADYRARAASRAVGLKRNKSSKSTSATSGSQDNWLPRIRALIREKRDEGHRILTLDEQQSDVMYRLESWAMRTGDLLLDAYGVGVKHEFREAAGTTGLRAFEPLLVKLAELIERADQLPLLDTFRFEDWESS